MRVTTSPISACCWDDDRRGDKADALTEILAEFERRRAKNYGPDDALLAADPAKVDGLALRLWGIIDLAPALKRLLHGVAEHMPVDVHLPDVRAVGRCAACRAEAPTDRQWSR